MLEDVDVRARDLRVELATARVTLRKSKRWFQFVFWTAATAFVSGIAYPSRSVAGVLIAAAAVGFIAATFLARRLDESGHRVARLSLDADR